ncbi:MAG: TetR family transcriptional regulator C-terminal domain-containing protein [Rhizobiaceae bacterium]|nr:TetR family transcriptional regulator C-terminal domain-containing protein [Rhizobiaceae bacterium]
MQKITAPKKAPLSRIQEKNRNLILKAGLEVFSKYGFRGATVDQLANAAGMSKPNLLYYFPSKEAVHVALLEELLENWLEPLIELGPSDNPIDEILVYVKKKLAMSRAYPLESRLYANEILQGAPNFSGAIKGPLKELVDEKAKLIQSWSDEGKIAVVNPYHLIFSIWSTTQHYADFDVQIAGILPTDKEEITKDAETYLEHMFRSILTPKA